MSWLLIGSFVKTNELARILQHLTSDKTIVRLGLVSFFTPSAPAPAPFLALTHAGEEVLAKLREAPLGINLQRAAPITSNPALRRRGPRRN